MRFSYTISFCDTYQGTRYIRARVYRNTTLVVDKCFRLGMFASSEIALYKKAEKWAKKMKEFLESKECP